MKYRLYLLGGVLLFLGAAFFLTTDLFRTSANRPLTDAELAQRANEIMNSQARPSTSSSTSSMPENPLQTEPTADNVSSGYYERVKDLESFLESHPADTTHMLRLARLLHQGHQLRDATLWYERLIEQKPQDIQIRLDLINAYGQAGQWELALQAADKLLEMKDGHPQALYNKAAIYANMGKKEDAKAIWQNLQEREDGTTIGTMSRNALEKLAAM